MTNIGPGVPMTERQEAIWRWMLAYLAEHQRPASMQEIADAFGIRSRNGIACHIRTLIKRGRVKQAAPNSSRGFIPLEANE